MWIQKVWRHAKTKTEPDVKQSICLINRHEVDNLIQGNNSDVDEDSTQTIEGNILHYFIFGKVVQVCLDSVLAHSIMNHLHVHIFSEHLERKFL